MTSLTPALQGFLNRDKARYIDANNNHSFRASLIPNDYIQRDFSQADTEVNLVVNRINNHLKERSNKVLMVFDLDGTLTDSDNPDATLATQIPENISSALSKLARKPNYEVAILTARAHHSLNQIKLDPGIRKYASNGEMRLEKVGDDKFHFDIEPRYRHLYTEANALREKLIEDPYIKDLIASGNLAVHSSISNLAIGLRQDLAPRQRRPILAQLKEIVAKYLPETWRYFSEYENDSNLFYCSKEVYGSTAHEKTNYQWKGPGLNRICEDLSLEEFHPSMVVCVGDSKADLTMMDEARSWNQFQNLFETVNIAVGDKIPKDSPSITHRFKDPSDVYETILQLAA